MMHPPPMYAAAPQAMQATVVGSVAPPPAIFCAPQAAPAQVTMFGSGPQQCYCPRCNATITSNVHSEVCRGTHIAALMLCGLWFISVGLCCCCCLPYLLPVCKERRHQCPQCNAVIGKKPFVVV
mmetsp:Transcript_50710/g.113971  ORF Transcript_50710/g.113971 Transcript_50710/m.113971 type:complete len:124 (+) Transcript_50710:185-556(+)